METHRRVCVVDTRRTVLVGMWHVGGRHTHYLVLDSGIVGMTSTQQAAEGSFRFSHS